MYKRVIPRDLFNEANLLKCYGQIYINLEYLNIPGVEIVSDGNAFDVVQDEGGGSLTIANVHLVINGNEQYLYRPLNSRQPWPLYLSQSDEEISVFNDDGSFTSDMIKKLME
jgi:hypothetical protein